MYEVNGWFKFAEQDSYDEGCLPETGFTFSGDERWSAETIPELLKKLRDFVGIDDDYEILLDSCEEDGRIDIQVMENADGYTVTSAGWFEKFKRGELALWYATYTFMVEKVERSAVNLHGFLDSLKTENNDG